MSAVLSIFQSSQDEFVFRFSNLTENLNGVAADIIDLAKAVKALDHS